MACPIDNSTHLLLASLNTLGEAVLKEAFHEAAWWYTKPHRLWDGQPIGTTRIGSMALATIVGSGLELILQTYHLDYDADELRTRFLALFRARS